MKKMEIEQLKTLFEEVKMMLEEENPNIKTGFPLPSFIEENKGPV